MSTPDRSLGMVKTALAYRMLANGNFSEASGMFLSALLEQDIQHMIESVSDNSSVKFESASSNNTDKQLSLAQIEYNNSLRHIQINPKPDTYDRYDSFDHLPGDDFYQDLLEEDSLTNNPILATLSCDPALPDVIQVYTTDEFFEGFEDNDKSFEKDLADTREKISGIDWDLENLGGESFKHKKAEEDLKKKVAESDDEDTDDSDDTDEDSGDDTGNDTDDDTDAEADAAFSKMSNIS